MSNTVLYQNERLKLSTSDYKAKGAGKAFKMFNAIASKLKHLHTCISERYHVKRLKMHL